MDEKVIKTALISVYDKTGLDHIIKGLVNVGVKIISTGGTKTYIEGLGVNVTPVEELTSYPSILGGRVKTLHPKIFGGILSRMDNNSDLGQLTAYGIEPIDLVVVDLYPFENTVASGATEEDIIEKIDIGGISLIRAAAKNFRDVVIIPSKKSYTNLQVIIDEKKGYTSLEERKKLSLEAFNISSHYDTAIFNYFNREAGVAVFKQSLQEAKPLRYGENPHQKGTFYGNFDALFTQIHGKEISYNNLLDIEAAVYLIDEFSETTFAILKHNNACGIASRSILREAWKAALAGDPVSAFGGILITNTQVDEETAIEIDQLFLEVIIAPSYDEAALKTLKSKKNRIILIRNHTELPKSQFRTLLNGVIEQDRDLHMEARSDMRVVTEKGPTEKEFDDLEFANKIVKHTKSNTIVMVANKQLIASGVGQTSRVDALKQAIEKARSFGFNTEGCVMASDAFFPFPDCVEIAGKAGVTAVVQPGGSVKDNDSIAWCNKNGMAMVVTGYRHFKH